MMLRKKWTMRESAAKLGISLGAISESLKLAKAVTDNHELERLTREEALDRIRK